MIQGRWLFDFNWQVFQHGHFGWWWTDGYGIICRRNYRTKRAAKAAMEKCRNGK